MDNENERKETVLNILQYWKVSGFLNQSGIPTKLDIRKNSSKARTDILHRCDNDSSIEWFIEQDGLEKSANSIIGNTILCWVGSVKKIAFVRAICEEYGIDFEMLPAAEIPKDYEEIPFCSFRTDIEGKSIKRFVISPLLWTAAIWHVNDAAHNGDLDIKVKEYKSFRDDIAYLLSCNEKDSVDTFEIDKKINDLAGAIKSATGIEIDEQWVSALMPGGRDIEDTIYILHETLKKVLDIDRYNAFQSKDTLEGTNEETPRSNHLFTFIYTRYDSMESKKADRKYADRYLPVNDFFVEDLDFIEDKIKDGEDEIKDREFGTENEYERSIMDYILSLTPEVTSKRLAERIPIDPFAASDDERNNIKNCFNDIFNIKYTPLGKWPSGHSPGLMQQAAINIASSELSPPIFSVNGPPGSGKTTMLKELVADCMVKRAIVLSELDDPDELFTESTTKRYLTYYAINENYAQRIKKLQLIAVATTNNAAENISKEFPKIFTENDTADDHYFGKYADELFGGKNLDLLSVPLGNSENRTRFAKKVLEPLIDDYEKAEDDYDVVIERYSKAKSKFTDQLDIVQKMRDKGFDGENALDDNFFDDYFSSTVTCRTRAETSSPNITEEYDKQREELFKCACELHKQFVLGSMHLFENLKALEIMWKSSDEDEKVNSNDKSDESDYPILSILPTLFLLTPLISATFASISTFMKHIKVSGALGTLIADESGQTKPQLALGILFRCSSAIIVGDPRQLPPIADNEPNILKRVLLLKCKVPLAYLNENGSLQSFADSLNPYGRYLSGESNNEEAENRDESKEAAKEWVGCPLVIHRRCDDPMFTISNTLSYDNTLIKQTKPRRRGPSNLALPVSCWIDISGSVKGNKPDSHYYNEQGLAAARILVKAFKGFTFDPDKPDIIMPDIFIITPYVSVVEGMLGFIRNSEFYDNIPLLRDWYADRRVGTIHTFQGREADEVIILLGRAGNEFGEFITRNIVNTAVTRAKRRIYFIGNIREWRSNSYIRTAFDIITGGNDGKNPKKRIIKGQEELDIKITGNSYGKCTCGCHYAEAIDLVGTYLTCYNKACSNYGKKLCRLRFGRFG